MTKYREKPWTWAAPSASCQVIVSYHGEATKYCGAEATVAYHAMCGGFMSLCERHGFKHRLITLPIADARSPGRTRAWEEEFARQHDAYVARRKAGQARPKRPLSTRGEWRARREGAGLSIEDAAARVGITAGTLYVYEHGRMPASTGNALLLVYADATSPEPTE